MGYFRYRLSDRGQAFSLKQGLLFLSFLFNQEADHYQSDDPHSHILPTPWHLFLPA